MRSTSLRYAGVFDQDRLLFETNICHQSIFYRRELFASIGPYNLRYRAWADWDFNIRCFSNTALVTRYMDIVVARFNDMTGLSTKSGTKSFRSGCRTPQNSAYGLARFRAGCWSSMGPLEIDSPWNSRRSHARLNLRQLPHQRPLRPAWRTGSPNRAIVMRPFISSPRRRLRDTTPPLPRCRPAAGFRAAIRLPQNRNIEQFAWCSVRFA